MATYVRALTLALLNSRALGATVCPSEVARAIFAASDSDVRSPDWRSVMPSVDAVIDELVAEGAVQLTWKGTTLPTRTGPYRIGHPNKAD